MYATFTLLLFQRLMPDRQEQILILLKQNNQKGIEYLFNDYFEMLCLRSIRVVKKREVAEDLVQDLFLEIWNKRETLNITSSIKSYLFRSIVNRSLNWLRANKQIFDEVDEGVTNRSDDYNITHTMQKNELEDYITSCIDELPEKCRLVFILSRFEELSYKEIASKLEISVKTVENQISKALKLLRSKMEIYYENY